MINPAVDFIKLSQHFNRFTEDAFFLIHPLPKLSRSERNQLICTWVADQFKLFQDKVCIHYFASGQPYLCLGQEARPISISISHSQHYLAIAVSLNNTVGIDIEYLRENLPILEIAQTYFSPQEFFFFQKRISKKQQKLLFYQLWSCKEAILKLQGIPLSEPICAAIDLSEILPKLQKETEFKQIKNFSVQINGKPISLCLYFDSQISHLVVLAVGLIKPTVV